MRQDGFEIEVSGIRVDGRGVPGADSEMLLDFVCTFVVRAHGVEVFSEVEFPLVELASQVATWLAAGKKEDFDYDSMESAVVSLVYFHRTEGGWTIGSMQEDSPPTGVVTDEELDRGLGAFLSLVPVAIDRFGVDVRRFVKSHAKRRWFWSR